MKSTTSYDIWLEKSYHPENYCNCAMQLELEEAKKLGYDTEELNKEARVCADCGTIYE